MITMMIFVIAVSNQWTWGESDNGHLMWCPNDNPSMFDEEIDTLQSYYFDECFDCSSSGEAFEICQQHADFEIGFEYRGFAMGWINSNVWVTAKQVAGFSADDKQAVLAVWFNDCVETNEKDICALAQYGQER